MPRFPRPFLLAVPAMILACATDAGNQPVATAAGHEWTVEEATALLASAPHLPASEATVRTLASLWVDYTLLATAVSEDRTLTNVDVSDLVREQIQDLLLREFRSAVLGVDTTITAAELRARYESEATGSRVRARQILLAWPDDPTQAQRDSLRRAAREIWQRVADGEEEFADLARRVSQDQATAPSGGDMGVVRRGQLLPGLSEALFAIEPGQITPPVETAYGIHILRLEERVTPPLAAFRNELLARRAAEAESTFVARLEEQVEPEYANNAGEVVRQIAADPGARMDEDEQDRPLVFYRGGDVTAGEVLAYLRTQPPELRFQVARSPDETIPERVLQDLTRRELAVGAATARGIAVPLETQQELTAAARRNLAAAADQLGLVASGDSREERNAAIEEDVATLLHDMLSGERREVTPLGAMSYVLRDRYPWAIHQDRLADVANQARQRTDDGQR